MYNDKHTIHLFSHLPKTGGTTIRKVIEANYKMGNNYFHFAINGFKTMSKIGKSPYDSLAHLDKITGDNLILFGHRVNESMLYNKMHYKVEITTMLRHPFSRVVSQYYMRKNSEKHSDFKDINRYLSKSTKDVMCKFFIKKFPSFVSNPFASLFNQARDVLQHFNNISFLEDAPNSFQKTLNIFDLKYDSAFDSNMNSEKTFRKTVTTEDINSNFHSNFRQDLELYYSIKENHDTRIVKQIPSVILLPNYWMVYLFIKINNDRQLIQQFYPCFKSIAIKKLIEPQLKLERLDFKLLLKTLIIVQNEFEVSQELKDNFFHLFNFILSNIDSIPSLSKFEQETKYGQIIQAMQKSNCNSIQDIKNEIVLSFPENNIDGLIAKANYYKAIKDFKSELNILLKAIKIYPLEQIFFLKIHEVAHRLKDTQLYYKSYIKYFELSGTVPKLNS